MNSIEAKVEQLIAVFHADPAYRRTALAVRCLSSDTRVNQVKAELFCSASAGGTSTTLWFGIRF